MIARETVREGEKARTSCSRGTVCEGNGLMWRVAEWMEGKRYISLNGELQQEGLVFSHPWLVVVGGRPEHLFSIVNFNHVSCISPY